MQKDFNRKVLEFIRRIPKGKVTTYKQIAIAIGMPNAARAVGNACKKNPYAPKVPCHRVVKSNGSLGGYSKGQAKKKMLLSKEGVKVLNGKIVGFSKKLFVYKNNKRI